VPFYLLNYYQQEITGVVKKHRLQSVGPDGKDQGDCFRAVWNEFLHNLDVDEADKRAPTSSRNSLGCETPGPAAHFGSSAERYEPARGALHSYMLNVCFDGFCKTKSSKRHKRIKDPKEFEESAQETVTSGPGSTDSSSGGDTNEDVNLGADDHRPLIPSGKFTSQSLNRDSWAGEQVIVKVSLLEERASPSGHAEIEDDRNLLEFLLNKLAKKNAEYAAILGLHLSGLSHEEIRKELGITETNSKQRLKRARLEFDAIARPWLVLEQLRLEERQPIELCCRVPQNLTQAASIAKSSRVKMEHQFQRALLALAGALPAGWLLGRLGLKALAKWFRHLVLGGQPLTAAAVAAGCMIL